MDSLKALGHGMNVKFRLPESHVSKDEMKLDFAQTVKDWSNFKWYEFGHGLGNLMQESVITFFPKKYSLGVDGLLSAELEEPASRMGIIALFPAALHLVAGFSALKHRS